MENWLYNGEEFTDPGKYLGFVYVILNKITGEKYIGRKYFTMAGYKTVKGVKKKIRKSSGWENYWSSSPRLKLDIEKYGKEKFTRTIIRLCLTKTECSYYETKMIFETDALLNDDYVNDWVSAKITRMHVLGFLKLYKN